MPVFFAFFREDFFHIFPDCLFNFVYDVLPRFFQFFFGGMGDNKKFVSLDIKRVGKVFKDFSGAGSGCRSALGRGTNQGRIGRPIRLGSGCRSRQDRDPDHGKIGKLLRQGSGYRSDLDQGMAWEINVYVIITTFLEKKGLLLFFFRYAPQKAICVSPEYFGRQIFYHCRQQ